MSEHTPLLNNPPADEESTARSASSPLAKGKLDPRSPLVIFAIAGLALLFVSIVTVAAILIFGQPDGEPIDHDPLLNSLKLSHILSHLQYLESSANLPEHRGSRSVTNGYNASAEYVATLLTERANCDIHKQYFRVPIWEETGKHSFTAEFEGHNISYQPGIDFAAMRYGGQAAILINKKVVHVPGNGCADENYDGLDVSGRVVLVQEGEECELWDVAWRAEGKKASAVIIYNSPRRKTLVNARIRISDWKDGDPLMSIPVISATHSLGQTLAVTAEYIRIFLETKTRMSIETTFNVLCKGRRGDEENSLVFGAHLDSVPAGPGLVDNASGSASLLEIALLLSHLKFHSFHHITFAWWGAEELGLLGSRHFVRNLSKKGKKRIALALNFDMLGSPNWVPYIHNGSDAPPEVRNASIQIQRAFEQYFTLKNLNYEITSMVAGSDFLPFLFGGIPAGGLLTGAGDLKTEKQRHRFGGMANAPFDPCYHQPCDTFENLSHDAIDVMSHAALYVISRLSRHKLLKQYLAGEVPLE